MGSYQITVERNMYLTFGQAKESYLTDIASACADDNLFASYINQATDRLMKRGNWWGTVSRMTLCVFGSCVTWPRQVDQVLATNLCGVSRPVQGNWYSMMPLSGGDIGSRRGEGDFWFEPGLSGDRRLMGRSSVVAENQGQIPVFNPIHCTANYIRVFPRYQADLGKNITFYGFDQNNQEVMQKNAAGAWVPGQTLVLALPFAQTPMQFREITRVLKDATQGPVDCYQYDAVNNVLLDLAHYQASETSPSYIHTVIKNFHRACHCNSRTNPITTTISRPRQVTALVKLRFIPVVNDDDLVLIDNLGALKQMILAIKKEDAGDANGFAEYLKLAINELNVDLRDKIPLDQIPVNVMSMGTAIPSKAGIGRNY